MKTYDEPVTFCHRCGLFNDEAKNIKWNNVMDATISTSASNYRLPDNYEYNSRKRCNTNTVPPPQPTKQ